MTLSEAFVIGVGTGMVILLFVSPLVDYLNKPRRRRETKKNKIELLIKEVQTLNSEVVSLKSTVESLRMTAETHRQQIRHLETKSEILRIAIYGKVDKGEKQL